MQWIIIVVIWENFKLATYNNNFLIQSHIGNNTFDINMFSRLVCIVKSKFLFYK